MKAAQSAESAKVKMGKAVSEAVAAKSARDKVLNAVVSKADSAKINLQKAEGEVASVRLSLSNGQEWKYACVSSSIVDMEAAMSRYDKQKKSGESFYGDWFTMDAADLKKSMGLEGLVSTLEVKLPKIAPLGDKLKVKVDSVLGMHKARLAARNGTKRRGEPFG